MILGRAGRLQACVPSLMLAVIRHWCRFRGQAEAPPFAG